MISHISRILVNFRPCFSRKAAFNWFVVVVFGFIVGLDHCGVSSFVRWLGIRPEPYTALVSHFRDKSWRLPFDYAPLVANRAGELPAHPNRWSPVDRRRRLQNQQGGRKNACLCSTPILPWDMCLKSLDRCAMMSASFCDVVGNLWTLSSEWINNPPGGVQ